MQISYLKYRLTSCTLLAPTSLFPKSKFRSPYCLQHILPSASPTSASASLLLQGLRPALTLPIPWKNRSQHCPGRCKPHGRRKPAAFTQLWITLRYPAHHNRAWVTGWYIAAWWRAAIIAVTIREWEELRMRLQPCPCTHTRIYNMESHCASSPCMGMEPQQKFSSTSQPVVSTIFGCFTI